jgi:hypothetical protein
MIFRPGEFAAGRNLKAVTIQLWVRHYQKISTRPSLPNWPLDTNMAGHGSKELFFHMGRRPNPELPFLPPKKGNPKKGAPTKIPPFGPVCSVGCAKFWELASLRQPKILNAPPRSQPWNFPRGNTEKCADGRGNPPVVAPSLKGPRAQRDLWAKISLPKSGIPPLLKAPTVGWQREGRRDF